MARLQHDAEEAAKARQRERDEDALDGFEVEESVDDDEEEKGFDPQEALLFVYLCSHVAEISKGKMIAGTYLVASDTKWTSKEALAHSALRLETLASALADIQVLMDSVNISSLFFLLVLSRKRCRRRARLSSDT